MRRALIAPKRFALAPDGLGGRLALGAGGEETDSTLADEGADAGAGAGAENALSGLGGGVGGTLCDVLSGTLDGEAILVCCEEDDAGERGATGADESTELIEFILERDIRREGAFPTRRTGFFSESTGEIDPATLLLSSLTMSAAGATSCSRKRNN